MRKLRALWIRLIGLLQPRRADREFAAEIESHISIHIDEGMRAGLSEQMAALRVE